MAWTPHDMAPASLGGSGPTRLHVHLCWECEAAHADPSPPPNEAMAAALLDYLDPDRALRRSPKIPRCAGCRAVRSLDAHRTALLAVRMGYVAGSAHNRDHSANATPPTRHPTYASHAMGWRSWSIENVRNTVTADPPTTTPIPPAMLAVVREWTSRKEAPLSPSAIPSDRNAVTRPIGTAYSNASSEYMTPSKGSIVDLSTCAVDSTAAVSTPRRAVYASTAANVTGGLGLDAIPDTGAP